MSSGFSWGFHAGFTGAARHRSAQRSAGPQIMMRVLKSIGKFVIVLSGTTVVFSMIWGGFITDTLYNCTDAVGFDYVHPSDWVHEQIAVVDHVVAGRSMSEPDTIKKGWSVGGLWALWISFFTVSLVCSFVLARKTWMPAWSAEPEAAPNGGPAAPVNNSRLTEGPPLVSRSALPFERQ